MPLFAANGIFGSIYPGFFRLTTAAKSSAGGPKQKLHIPNFVNFNADQATSSSAPRSFWKCSQCNTSRSRLSCRPPRETRHPMHTQRILRPPLQQSLKGYPLGTIPQRFYIIGACRRRPFLDRSCFLDRSPGISSTAASVRTPARARCSPPPLCPPPPFFRLPPFFLLLLWA